MPGWYVPCVTVPKTSQCSLCKSLSPPKPRIRMLFKYIAAAAPFLAGTCLAQDECAYRGWGTGVDIGYYGDPLSATQAACSALCDANTACLSFSYNTAGPNCILYDYAVEGNAVYDPASPNNFFNRGSVCPAIPTPAPTSTLPIPTAAPTCTGYPGWDTGSNIGKSAPPVQQYLYICVYVCTDSATGFYPDAYSASYGGCLALCDANEECLSFGILTTPACALYNYTVEGNNVYDPASGNIFYNKGGVCPATPTSTAPPVPTQTGLFPNVSISPPRLASSAV